MCKIRKILGYVWASPVSVFGLTYACIFTSLGWYKWNGVNGDALVWTLDYEASPDWLKRLWHAWEGHAIGNAVVLRFPPDERRITMVHELKHVDQAMRLGIFLPFLYAINYLAIKIGCPGSDPYYSNSFEIDARRHAGQVVDVEGTVKKINEKVRR